MPVWGTKGAESAFRDGNSAGTRGVAGAQSLIHAEDDAGRAAPAGRRWRLRPDKMSNIDKYFVCSGAEREKGFHGNAGFHGRRCPSGGTG